MVMGPEPSVGRDMGVMKAEEMGHSRVVRGHWGQRLGHRPCGANLCPGTGCRPASQAAQGAGPQWPCPGELCLLHGGTPSLSLSVQQGTGQRSLSNRRAACSLSSGGSIRHMRA